MTAPAAAHARSGTMQVPQTDGTSAVFLLVQVLQQPRKLLYPSVPTPSIPGIFKLRATTKCVDHGPRLASHLTQLWPDPPSALTAQRCVLARSGRGDAPLSRVCATALEPLQAGRCCSSTCSLQALSCWARAHGAASKAVCAWRGISGGFMCQGSAVHELG